MIRLLFRLRRGTQLGLFGRGKAELDEVPRAPLQDQRVHVKEHVARGPGGQTHLVVAHEAMRKKRLEEAGTGAEWYGAVHHHADGRRSTIVPYKGARRYDEKLRNQWRAEHADFSAQDHVEAANHLRWKQEVHAAPPPGAKNSHLSDAQATQEWHEDEARSKSLTADTPVLGKLPGGRDLLGVIHYVEGRYADDTDDVEWMAKRWHKLYDDLSGEDHEAAAQLIREATAPMEAEAARLLRDHSRGTAQEDIDARVRAARLRSAIIMLGRQAGLHRRAVLLKLFPPVASLLSEHPRLFDLVHVHDSVDTSHGHKLAVAMRALVAMGPSVMSAFIARGARVTVADSVVDVDRHLAGVRPRGWDEGFTWDDPGGMALGRTCTLALGRTGSNKRVEEVLHHELGHVIDSLAAGAANRYRGASADPAFLEWYQKAADRTNDGTSQLDTIIGGDRGYKHFDYLHQDGIAGPSETFAELSRMMFEGKAARLEAAWGPRLTNMLRKAGHDALGGGIHVWPEAEDPR